MKKKISLIWIGAVLALCLGSGCGSSSPGTVYLMGAARLKLEVGENNKVKEAEGLNRQAASVLEAYGGKGMEIGEAAAGYVSQMAEEADPGTPIEISVVSEDQAWAEALAEELDQALSGLKEKLQLDLLVQTAEELNDSPVSEQLTAGEEVGEEPPAESIQETPHSEDETEETEGEESAEAEEEKEEERPAEEPAAAAAQTEAVRETERAGVQTQPESSAAVEIPETEPPAALLPEETSSEESVPSTEEELPSEEPSSEEPASVEEPSAPAVDGPGALIGESRAQM